MKNFLFSSIGLCWRW